LESGVIHKEEFSRIYQNLENGNISTLYIDEKYILVNFVRILKTIKWAIIYNLVFIVGFLLDKL
jgi:hypothetical protein